MTDNNDNAVFWELAESFINMANEKVDGASPDAVNSALQYAAARFNAFIVAANSESLAEDKEDAIRYLSNHYRDTLRECLEDYIANPISSGDTDKSPEES